MSWIGIQPLPHSPGPGPREPCGRVLHEQAVQVHGDGHTAAAGPGVFVWTSNFYLADELFEVAVTTTVLSIMELPQGMFVAQTSHTFDFGDGDTLVTTDRARLYPTGTPGLYWLESALTITGGSGLFAGAHGHLRGQPGSTIDLLLGEANWWFAGVITLQP